MAIDLSTFTLFERYSEMVDVKRQDKENTRQRVDVVSDVSIAILPNFGSTSPTLQGNPVDTSEFSGYFETPQNTVKIGDVIVRRNGEKDLYVTGNHVLGTVHVVELERTPARSVRG